MSSPSTVNTDSGPGKSPMSICFDLPESLAHIVHLRKTSRCLVESLGLCLEDTDDLEMLLGELSTNVVRHAKAGKYHVEMEFLPDRCIVTVMDKGIGFPSSPPEPFSFTGTPRTDTLSTTGEERFGGMGLVLIRAIVDQLDIYPSEPQGTTVRAEKVLKPPKPETQSAVMPS